MQGLVQKIVKRYNLEISPELRYVDLVSEIGELGKELLKSTDYGKEEFKKTENTESEIGDIVFSLTCIANSLEIDIEQALIGVMKKYQSRFSEKGSIGSEVVSTETEQER
ncbi:MAG: nucleotide pyrophosphohydrolase [Clostridia bacterium]|nr:nucleotide pyrophosphohydrolase [Clostridia bacterium]